MKKTSIASPVANPSRRQFVVGSATAAGGLALGMHLPMLMGGAEPPMHRATPNSTSGCGETDDSCLIRIARSEMGQGTATGLAQLVAEELECDWKKSASNTHPRPELRQERAWGNMSTGGSAASAPRKTTCAAAARRRASCCCKRLPTMEGAGSPNSPSRMASSLMPQHRSTSYGKVATAAASSRLPMKKPSS